MDAEKHLLRDGDVAGKTPEHIRRVKLGEDIAVVKVEILLVCTEQGGGTEHRANSLESALFIAGLCLRERPVGTHPWPEGIVVIIGHVGDLRIEHRRTERCVGIVLGNRLLPIGRRYVIEDGEGLAEGLGAGIENLIATPVGIHAVVSFCRHPEMPVYVGGEFVGPGIPLRGLALPAEDFGHVGHSLQRGGIHHVGAHCLALRYIDGLHPARIALLAPVDKGGLPLDKAALTHHGLLILLERTDGNGIDCLQPFPVARNLIYLVCRQGPHHSVGRDRPRAARTGVLDDLSARIHLLHERDHRSLWLQGGHGKDYRIADIAGPYA